MKRLPLSLLLILLFTACQKEITTTKAQEEIARATANKQTKLIVCHYDPLTGTSKTIEVTQNALASHLAHGDLQGECSAVRTTICDQDWMVKNLDVDKYRDGTPIPQATSDVEWIAAGNAGTGAWCYYENTSSNETTYGKLYNWYAVNDPRGLAPTGWHIPTDAEWTTLSSCLGGDPVAGGKMKSVGTIEDATGLWYAPNMDATNSSGFTGLPGGIRNEHDGSFSFIGINGNWWSSSEYGSISGTVWYRGLSYWGGFIDRSYPPKQRGISVRCLRDN